MNVVEARDLGAFIPSNLDDYGLDPFEFRLYCHIARRAGAQGSCWEGVQKMAKVCAMDRKTVMAKLESLEQKRLLRAERQLGKTTTITLTNAAEWLPPSPTKTSTALSQKRDRGSTRNGIGTSTRNGTSARNGTSTKNGIGTSTKNGIGVVPETVHKGTPLKVLPEGLETRSKHSRQESKTNSALGERGVSASDSFQEDSEAQSAQHPDVVPIAGKRLKGKKGLPRLNSRARVSEHFSRVPPGGGTDEVLGQIARLAEFAGFWDWYGSKVCDPCGAKRGALADAAKAWLSLEASEFLGQGYEEFRKGCLEYLKGHKGEKQIGVRYACRFLVGGPRCGQASWLDVLESKGTTGDSSAFLKGVDDSHDLEATRQNIGLELVRCGRNSVLPPELAAGFGKQMASQLDASESVVYLQWLRSQPSREVQHAV